MLLIMATGVAAAPPARFGRIDVYSADGTFDVRDVRASPDAQVLDVGWRGPEMASSGATAQARVREMWREIWVEVVPEQDGKLQINFQGEYYRKQNEDDVRLVWVDQIQVSGAELINGDLEKLEEDGVPRGWQFSGQASAEAVSRDGSIAASGRVCAAVWYGAQLRQTVDVRAGHAVRVTAKFRATGPEREPAETTQHNAQFDHLLELQPQTITVRLASSDTAHLAKIRPLPLFDGADWAVTSRWDDNTWTDLKTRRRVAPAWSPRHFLPERSAAELLRQGLRAAVRTHCERIGKDVGSRRNDHWRALANPSDDELSESQPDVRGSVGMPDCAGGGLRHPGQRLCIQFLRLSQSRRRADRAA